jgi:hypothetical protein
MDDANIKYHVICSWWLLSKAASEGGNFGLSECLDFWHFCYKQWGGHILFVGTYQSSFIHIYIYIYIYPHNCVLFIGYDNKKTCRNVNMQSCRECTQQMAPILWQQDDLFI